jgi:hypothetical protein
MAKSFKGGLDSLIAGVAPKKKAKVKGAVKQPPSPPDTRGSGLPFVPEEWNRKKPGRPRTSTKVPKDTTEEGTLPGEKRATFIVKEEQLEKLKAVAYWDRSKIKDVITAALEKYLDAYEKKNGPIKKVKQ